MAGAWAEAARKGIKEDEEALETANHLATTTQFGQPAAAAASAAAGTSDSSTRAVNGESVAGGRSGLAIAPLERQEDVEMSFGDAVRGLGRLKREMPAVVARMERARKAGEYVVTER